MAEKDWQKYSLTLKELLVLEYSPVAVAFVKGPIAGQFHKKVRICWAILDAGKGESVQLNKTNNACFGASWHLGFQKIQDPGVVDMVKRFVVEGEKLFCSYEALERLMSHMEPVPDNSQNSFMLTPMENADFEPQVIIFVVNAESACRLLTLTTFLDGRMPKIKIGGPTCRMTIIYPLLTGEVNISFYDYTARKMCKVEKDKLLVTIPYSRVVEMVESIEKCSAGKAKIEFPPEFREFLQKRLTTQAV